VEERNYRRNSSSVSQRIPSPSQQLLQAVAISDSRSGNALAVEVRAPTSRLTISHQPTFTTMLSAQLHRSLAMMLSVARRSA
jgi:hypothetical protein